MKWIKPNGQEIETNDRPETIEHCESIGWKEARKPAKEKQTLPRKEDVNRD
jgi:hypothetical protein